jgi:hypothetical protein
MSVLIKLYDFNSIYFKTNNIKKIERLCKKLEEVRDYCIYKMTGYKAVN